MGSFTDRPGRSNGDHVKSGTIFYDPLILNADGTSKSDGSRLIDLAIENYLRDLPFDGRLKRTSITDSILASEGVFDVQVSILQHKYAAYDYQDIEISHVPESGYFNIDPLFPLTEAFTYIPHV